MSPFTHTCKIVKVDETVFNQVADSIPGINVVGNEISNQKCGSGTESSIKYRQTFSNDLYVFQVVRTDSGGTSKKDNFAFEVEGGQAVQQ